VSHADGQLSGPHRTAPRPHGDDQHRNGHQHTGQTPLADPSTALHHSDRQPAEPASDDSCVPAGQLGDAPDDQARVRPTVPAPRPALDNLGEAPNPDQLPWAPDPAPAADQPDRAPTSGRQPDSAPTSGQPADESAPGRATGVQPASWRGANHPQPSPEGSAEGQPQVGRSAQPYVPRRAFGNEPPAEPDTSASGEHQAPAGAGVPGPAESLPQRVPAPPDVSAAPNPSATEPPAETPELARIATHLRRESPSEQAYERPDGFDVNAILAAVRGVAGVRDASLRTTCAGAHRLRLDLADGADSAEVSRQVARLLQERMGLAAAPQNLPGGLNRVPERPDAGARRPGRGDVRDAGGRRAGSEAAVPRRRRLAPPDPTGAAGPDGAVAARPGVPTSRVGTGDAGQARVRATAQPFPVGDRSGPRVAIDHVRVSVFGVDATVEVRLAAGERMATGLATGPAVDGYVLRLCAVAAASAIDELLHTSGRLTDRGRCFVEHAAVVPFGSCEVAVVVVLLVCDGSVEEVSGSALVAGDPRQAVVRATLSAVNRRLAGLL